MQHIVSYLYQLNNEICHPAHIIIHFLSAQLINSSNGKHAVSNISQPQRKMLTRSVFFNRGSTEPKDSASGIQGFRGSDGVQSKKNKLRPTFAAISYVFKALTIGPKCIRVVGAPPQTPLVELTVLPQTH